MDQTGWLMDRFRIPGANYIPSLAQPDRFHEKPGLDSLGLSRFCRIASQPVLQLLVYRGDKIDAFGSHLWQGLVRWSQLMNVLGCSHNAQFYKGQLDELSSS